MSTKHLHCSVSHISLSDRECVIFLIKKFEEINSLFGLPIRATYCEIKGEFIVDDSELELSYYRCSEYMKDIPIDYTMNEHEKLFKTFGNNSFSLFPIVSSVYEEISSRFNDYWDRIHKEFEKEICSSAELLLTTYNTSVVFSQMMKESENKEIQMPESLLAFQHSEFEGLCHDFKSEKEGLKNAFYFLDVCRKHDIPFSIYVSEPLGQISLNSLLGNKEQSFEEIFNEYKNSFVFCSCIGNVLPIKKVSINPYHQGSYVETYIEYHQSIVNALKKIKED